MIDTPIKGTKLTLGCLNNLYTQASSEYTKAMRHAKRLDAFDKGLFYEDLKAKFPQYQLLPYTNDISRCKNNILASIYTIGKSASLLPTSEEDRDVVNQLNVALEHIWDEANIGYYELLAGERAALLNIGITQVGWDANIVTGRGAKDKGRVSLKNISPFKYMRDPYASSLDTASYVVTWEDYHESLLESSPVYGAEFKKYKASGKTNTTQGAPVVQWADRVSLSTLAQKGYYRVFTWFVREGDKIREIHTVNNDWVLFVRPEIRPNVFPFAELYCNIPDGDLIGQSECAKILRNTICYNLMNSIALTAEYKKQRPTRFISGQSGINVNAFVKHGNDADKTFVVQGDASKAVHYQQYPEVSPQTLQTMQALKYDMQDTTGIDGKYTGRDTGSVLTTGGVEAMLDQATLIDTTKICLYEQYAKRLTMLVAYNYLCNSSKRSYIVKDNRQANTWKTIVVDYPKIPEDILFSYNINISSELPKNKARISAMAEQLIQMQMQYQGAGIDVDLITPQEYLEYIDLPNKEYMFERMNIQRNRNYTELVSQAVATYASLIDQGMSSADAISSTANMMQQQAQGTTPDAAGMDMNAVAQQAQLF